MFNQFFLDYPNLNALGEMFMSSYFTFHHIATALELEIAKEGFSWLRKVGEYLEFSKKNTNFCLF